MAIIYEITATVDPKLAERFEGYMLERHIPDLMRTGCFVSADIAKSADRYQMRYTADSTERLDEYLANYAKDLRADLAKNFPAGISVSREVWESISTDPGI